MPTIEERALQLFQRDQRNRVSGSHRIAWFELHDSAKELWRQEAREEMGIDTQSMETDSGD